MSADEWPTKTVNFPGSCFHAWPVTSKNDIARGSSATETRVDWPGAKSTRAEPFNSLNGRGTGAVGLPR